MSDEQIHIQQLLDKLTDLQKREEQFHSEILQIKNEIENLKSLHVKQVPVIEEIKSEIPEARPVGETETSAENAQLKTVSQVRPSRPLVSSEQKKPDSDSKSDIERFIGENLINKIGIAVTVIGVAIGSKYAIDHDLISPLVRIILGYLIGAGLLIFAVRLKKEYENFSSVLFSGSMAIMYFITYAAYSFFSLYPQSVTFFLMVIFTIVTVTAALKFDKEIIAIIGLVGAYAVPFLIGGGPDEAVVLFSYIAIINAGILVIAVKKYWKPLYFSAFTLTWIIYFSWYFGSYQHNKDFTLAFIFLFIYFLIFYITFLSYKLIKKEKFDFFDLVLLLTNSFILYGIGYSIFKDLDTIEKYLGLFTLGNGIVHLIISMFIYKNRLADRNLFYLVSGLFLVFITIAVPVQFDGNWVTLLWILQAALLFYIGRTKATPVYEYLSYPLIVLSFLSIAQDWGSVVLESLKNNPASEVTPFININFLSTLIFIASLSYIVYIYFNRRYTSPFIKDDSLRQMIDHALPGLLLVVIYLAFRTEISVYWNKLIIASKTEIINNEMRSVFLSDTDLTRFKTIWIVNYTLFFLAILTFVNYRYLVSKTLGIIAFWLTYLTIFIFLFQSLFILSELRDSFLGHLQSDSFSNSSFNITIRYISFLFVALSMAATWLWLRRENLASYFVVIFSLLFHLTLLWILSSEMLNIMDLLKNSHSYKFGLSILSGIYSLMLIVLGIVGRKKYLRVAAIVLFGVTLAKLFFYDISRLDTILKTVLFLALGFLMLIISFLYNKHAKHLFGEPADKD